MWLPSNGNYLEFDYIKEIFDLSNWMFLTVNNIFHQRVKSWNELLPLRVLTHASKKWSLPSSFMIVRAVRSTDFRNRLTVPPNSNRIRLTERSASPYGALCFHVFMGSDSPPGTSRLLLQVLSLLVSNQTSFTPIKRQSKIITCGVLMHKNKSLTWCHSPIVPSRINAM